MKKITLIAAFILIAGLTGLFAQHININPIPSFNYQLTALNTGFQERLSHGTPGREKRDMDVVISSSSTSPIPVFAKVWLAKDGIVVKGPYTIFLDQLLSVPISDGQWGVIIKCDWDVAASVWID
ncbi:MAG: hypothetical protein NT040_12195 [Bacteroidetes bacterium]|nr:hypothetical protein [Bacteroidota bacterium]